MTTSQRYDLLAAEMDVNAGEYLDGISPDDLGRDSLKGVHGGSPHHKGMAAACSQLLFAQAHFNEQAAFLAGGETAVRSNVGNGRGDSRRNGLVAIWVSCWGQRMESG